MFVLGLHLVFIDIILFLLLLLSHLEELSANAFTVLDTEFIIEDGVGDDWTDIINHRKHLKGGNETHELIIFGVIVPRSTGKSILRLELVTVRRVVNDDYICQVSPRSFHILHELSSVESTVFSEQALGSNTIRI
jgi:hypothetical protein